MVPVRWVWIGGVGEGQSCQAKSVCFPTDRRGTLGSQQEARPQRLINVNSSEGTHSSSTVHSYSIKGRGVYHKRII